MKNLKHTVFFIFNYLEEIILISCMFGIVILTFSAVIARYFLHIPIPGSDEIATYMFLWASLFGASAAFKYNKHGGIPLIVDRLSAKLRRFSDLSVLAVTAAFFAFLSYYSWHFLSQSIRVGQISPATGIPAWTINAGLFLALAMCSLRCLIAIFRDLMGMDRYPKVPVSKNTISEDNLKTTSKP